ncbi:MAG: hypothetical protein WD768_08965 [Phycisphaeraceae bacterium]
MSIHIDGIPTALPGTTLGELVLAAQQRLEPSGRVVVEVTLNDQPIVGNELAARQHEAVGTRVVKLTTADPKELVIDTLGEISRHLNQAGELQNEAADLLQRDKEKDALGKISDAMSIWQQTEEAVRHSAAMLSISLDTMTIDGQPFAAMTENLVQQLGGLRDLIKAHDTVGLADALAYEWPATVKKWQRMIELFVAKIQE